MPQPGRPAGEQYAPVSKPPNGDPFYVRPFQKSEALSLIAVVVLAGQVITADRFNKFEDRRSCLYYAATLSRSTDADFDCITEAEYISLTTKEATYAENR